MTPVQVIALTPPDLEGVKFYLTSATDAPTIAHMMNKGAVNMGYFSVGADNENYDMSFEEREKQRQEQEEAEKEARKKIKNSPYSNFYQFNRANSKAMIWLATNHPKASGILLFLLDQMDGYNAVICSNKVLSEALGISDSSVKRSTKVLKDHEFIAVYKSGSSNVYAVNKNLAWSSWGTNYQYAKFEAKIIISQSEQEETEEPEVTTVKHKEVKIKSMDLGQ